MKLFFAFFFVLFVFYVSAGYVNLTMNQKLDHFNYLDDRTFKQHYVVNADYYQPGGPVFLDITGEAPLEYFIKTYGFPIELASKYNALFVSLEHRYYGTSHPFPNNPTNEQMTYLSSQQQLADLAAFHDLIMDQFNLPENTTWIAFGCSYAGMLSAWFRMKYPHMIAGSYSGSSPVHAKIDFFEYNLVCQEALDPSCLASLNQALTDVKTLLQTPDGQLQLQQMFNVCTPFTDNFQIVSFEYSIVDYFQGVIQYNNPPNYPKETMCQILTSAPDPLQAYAELVVSDSNGNCIDLSSNGLKSVASGGNSWWWQCLTEFGFYQTFLANESFGFPDINVEYYQEINNIVFGITMDPDADFINQFFGSTDPKDVTNIIFTNSKYDPFLRNISDTVTSYVYTSAGHCAPFHFFNSEMQQDVIDARNAIDEFVQNIISSSKSSN
ncbi:protease s28 pro-x carboxypeptidase-related [Anaeramoeba ignava]|uniref:Protease s28 pro-x carboxypeptidase-related n=1 Tax=Anaeramoeba ignava TaxID=1746090 RepID=A0A9Q0RBW1_ANAIG|nr:protease s28 pro-x carboxypeptidase-related [Anaeramoeba ignava]